MGKTYGNMVVPGWPLWIPVIGLLYLVVCVMACMYENARAETFEDIKLKLAGTSCAELIMQMFIQALSITKGLDFIVPLLMN